MTAVNKMMKISRFWVISQLTSSTKKNARIISSSRPFSSKSCLMKSEISEPLMSNLVKYILEFYYLYKFIHVNFINENYVTNLNIY